MKILLAADGSPHTRQMLAYVAAHDEWLGTRHAYTALTVVPYMPARLAALADADMIEAYYRDEAERVFKPMRNFFDKQGLPVEFMAGRGNAAEEIARRADAGGFDLLMLGSHGHGSLANLLMGSVATRVLAQCRVPVLLVRG